MKQIKTILHVVVQDLDKEVNEALADGWMLVNRHTLPSEGFVSFVAELEREVITEAERTCENCCHYDDLPHSEPCASCSEDCDKWEAEL